MISFPSGKLPKIPVSLCAGSDAALGEEAERAAHGSDFPHRWDGCGDSIRVLE